MISQETARAILRAQDNLAAVEVFNRADGFNEALTIMIRKGYTPITLQISPSSYALAVNNELALARKALEDANARAKEELA